MFLFQSTLYANIRIDEQGAARITGFASAPIMVEPNITLEDIDESIESDLSRWGSPEVLHLFLGQTGQGEPRLAIFTPSGCSPMKWVSIYK